jgi:Mor family transcriptional regulator
MVSKSERNRQIFAAFEAGQSLEQLGEYHGLSPGRIHAVLVAEKHKRIISPEPFYRSLRGS